MNTKLNNIEINPAFQHSWIFVWLNFKSLKRGLNHTLCFIEHWIEILIKLKLLIINILLHNFKVNFGQKLMFFLLKIWYFAFIVCNSLFVPFINKLLFIVEAIRSLFFAEFWFFFVYIFEFLINLLLQFVYFFQLLKTSSITTLNCLFNFFNFRLQIGSKIQAQLKYCQILTNIIITIITSEQFACIFLFLLKFVLKAFLIYNYLLIKLIFILSNLQHKRFNLAFWIFLLLAANLCPFPLN